MKLGRTNQFLGAAVSDQAIVCAEIVTNSARPIVRHTATFVFPTGVSLETPDAAGQALATFLRQHKFAASRVVVGVPARWLIAVEKEVPPSDEMAARSMLRLQAERLAVAESGEVVFDFAGKTHRSTATKVLLVGMLQQRLARVAKLMDAAGMTIVAITSSGLTLASCLRKTEEGGVLLLNRGGAEMIWRTDGEPRMLRHFPVALNGQTNGTGLASLGAELKRAVAFAQPNGDDASRGLVMIDGVGLASKDVAELSNRLGLKVKGGDEFESLGMTRDTIETSKEEGPAGRFAPAAALALAGARPELLPMDFQHSRLRPEAKKRISDRAMWGIVAGAVVLIALVTLFIMVRRRQSTLNDLNAQLKQLDPQKKEAQDNLDRFEFGRGYFDSRPPILDALVGVTQAFRNDERIWATSFSMRDNKGQLAGRAADQKIVLTLLDRLKSNPHFTDVKFVDMREADTRTHETQFLISFGFKE